MVDGSSSDVKCIRSCFLWQSTLFNQGGGHISDLRRDFKLRNIFQIAQTLI